MDLEEIWKPIKKYPSYIISTHGNIRHIKRPNTNLSQYVNYVTGYNYVRLTYPVFNEVTQTKGTAAKTLSVHRLVASTFLKNDNYYSDVDHIDYNKTNNRIDNLRYCSHRMNQIRRNPEKMRGYSVVNRKNNEKSYRVKLYHLDGTYEYLTFRDEEKAKETFLNHRNKLITEWENENKTIYNL